MPSGLLPVDVRVEFLPDAGPPIDASPWIAWGEHPIRVSAGRSAERDTLAPRTLTVVLDNAPSTQGLAHRAWDPRNTSGPFYGRLLPRSRVRLRVNDGSGWRDLFVGVLADGWPQILDDPVRRFVRVEAVDCLGFLSQSTLPTSAHETELEVCLRDGPQPRFWLRTSPDGMVCTVSGASMSATAAMVECDPLVDGQDERAFYPAGGDGGCVSTTRSVMVVPTSASAGKEFLFSAWVRFGESPFPAEIWQEVDSSGNYVFRLSVALLNIRMDAGNASGRMSEIGTNTGLENPPRWDHLRDGAAHHFAVWVRLPSTSSGSARLWVDGVEQSLDWTNSASPVGDPVAVAVGREVRVSEFDGAVWDDTAVDHVVSWWDAGLTAAQVEALVSRLFSSGRLARVGERLDQRLDWISRSAGWSQVGALDPSAVVTPHGFRGGRTGLDLAQQIEDTEFGVVFADNTGSLRFLNRRWPFERSRSTTVQATLSDSPTTGKIPIIPDGTVIVDDGRLISNVVRVTRRFGREQVVADQASIQANGRRSRIDLNDLLLASDVEALGMAQFLLRLFKTGKLRVERAAFDAAVTVPYARSAAINLEPGDLVKVEFNGVDFFAHVEAVSHEIRPDSWLVSLELDGCRSGCATGTWWFRWGSSTWGGTDVWSF